MAKIMATCKICGQRFDRNSEPFVKVSERRYAHKECFDKNEENKSKEEKDYEQLLKYIESKLGENYSKAKITKQIKDFKKEYNYSYTGILKTLIWWLDINKKTLEGGGIGIVPFVYPQAYEYYKFLWMAQKANELEDIKSYNNMTKVVEIESPRANSHKKKIFILD